MIINEVLIGWVIFFFSIILFLCTKNKIIKNVLVAFPLIGLLDVLVFNFFAKTIYLYGLIAVLVIGWGLYIFETYKNQ